jgi:hypothetical protein
MEADWEVEIGPEVPVLEALWAGFVDLRRNPERIGEIAEAVGFPALAEALLHLNKSGSPVWTSKCDLWAPDPDSDSWDPDEMDATPTESAISLACYIDLLVSDSFGFTGLEEAKSWARATVLRLRKTVCRCCRADFVIRRAFQGDREGFGITAYATACGADHETAAKMLSAALRVLVKAIVATTDTTSKIGGALQ